MPSSSGLDLSKCQKTSDNTVEALISKSYYELAHEERNDSLNDIHGISKLTEETPEMIQDLLNVLDMELARIEEKPAYELAMSICHEYVSNETFRIMFLRSDDYDAKKSACRMVLHFQSKLELFGRDKLTKTITLSDFEDHEIEGFKSGYLQPLLHTDRGGRLVLFGIANMVPTNFSLYTRVSKRQLIHMSVYLLLDALLKISLFIYFCCVVARLMQIIAKTCLVFGNDLY
jgi:hypothetical protein